MSSLSLLLLLFLLPPPILCATFQTVVIGEVSHRDPTRPIYHVEFPPHSKVGAPSDSSLRVVTARGQALQCSLPPPQKTTPTPTLVRFDDVDELLKSYTGKCFVRVDGWWTYEFCYGKHVVQKHLIPPDRDPYPGEKEDIYVLGIWDEELDQKRRKESVDLSKGDGAFTQLYVNGTECEVGGRKRKAVVKYLCKDEAVALGSAVATAELNLLRKVNEIQTCVYEVEFMGAAICQHAAYRDRSRRGMREIRCEMEDQNEKFQGLASTTYRRASLSL